MMKPLFLVSLPRSGSTMTQAVLSNHSKIATCPEPWVQLVRASFAEPGLVKASFNWNLALRALGQSGQSGSPILEKIQENLAAHADKLYGSAGDQKSAYFLDKTPRYYLILPYLYDAYPDARFIILTRDLMSVLASVRKTWLGDRPPDALDDYAYDLLEAPRLLHRFVNERRDSARVKTIAYEEIVVDPSRVFTELFDWLGIGFEQRLLNYGGNQSFRGAMGDPKSKLSSQVQKPRENWPELVRETFPTGDWRRFADGYIREVGGWGLDPEWISRWGKGSRSIVFQAFMTRHFCYKSHWRPSLRHSAVFMLDALRRRSPMRTRCQSRVGR